ncbi:MAG: class I SAM-dependent methyltransferase, partial [Candidatus Aminicenantes bacterium]|nr:class I SAM-dependent methyltransferase [Candidatus Aminicenantes bacterium]
MSIYEKISEYYERIFPLKKGKVTFLESLLKKENQKILDLGCATGELALALSSKGHRVIGIDLDKNMVNMARSKAKSEGTKNRFYVKDMLDVGMDFPENSFDAVLCLGNTLVHLKNLDEIGNLIKGVFSILKRDGIFILQVVNFEGVLTGQINGLPLLENDTFAFERKYQYDKNHHHVMFKTSLFLKKSGESLKSL